MNKVYDYNGTYVSKSNPTRTLRTLKKVLSIDSADRDSSKYPTNGDFTVYLPRVYESIVSIRLMSGEFPLLTPQGTYGGGAMMHAYSNGPNAPSTDFSGDTAPASPYPYYFMIELEGLNKSDETALNANKSTYPESHFAKIPVLANTVYDSHLPFLEYNDHSGIENISRYNPPIGKLDRLRIRTRLHSQQGNQGFIYWTNNQCPLGYENYIVDYTLALEIEYVDNGFDEFSMIETRIHN